jgi:hypothetical protein
MTTARSAAPTWRLRSVERMRPRPGRACAGPTCRVFVYDIGMRTCPNCGQDRLEPIAMILNPDVIARIFIAMDRFARVPSA